MLDAGLALTEVDTAALKRALKHLHQGELRCPLTIEELTRCGLQYVAQPMLSHLRGMDATTVRAVLVAVLAERKAAEERR